MQFLVLAFLACALPLAALAQNLQKIQFRPSPDRPIATLAVLGVQVPRRVVVQNENPAGTAFGVLPALVYGLDMDKKAADYVAEMNKRKITLAPELARALHRELSRKYKVVWYTGRVPLKADKTPDYEKIPIEADAILYVFYGRIGYYSPSTETRYFPLMHLGARMLDRKSWQTVYYSQLASRPRGWRAESLFYEVDCDPSYSFPDFESLMAGFDRSIEGLILGQNQLAAQIARDLGVPERDADEKAKEKPEENRNEKTEGE